MSTMIANRKLASELSETDIETLTTDELQQACQALIQHSKVLERDVEGFRNDAQRLRLERNTLREKVDELTDSLEVADADRKRLFDELYAAKLEIKDVKRAQMNRARISSSPVPNLDLRAQSPMQNMELKWTEKKPQTDGLECVSSPSSTHSAYKANGKYTNTRSLMPHWNDFENNSSLSPQPPPPPPPPLPPSLPDQLIAPPPPPPPLLSYISGDNYEQSFSKGNAGPRTPPLDKPPPWGISTLTMNCYPNDSSFGPSPSAPYAMAPPSFTGMPPPPFGMRNNSLPQRQFNENSPVNSIQRNNARFNPMARNSSMRPTDSPKKGVPLICGKIIGPNAKILARNDAMMIADKLRPLSMASNLDQTLLRKNTHYHKCFCRPCAVQDMNSPADVVAHALSQSHLDKIYAANTGVSTEDFDYWMRVLEKSQSVDLLASRVSNSQHAIASSLDC